MSGGYFDYQQYNIGRMADDIEIVIENNECERLDDWGDRVGRGYPEEVIARFRDAVRALRVAQVYAQRADWLLSGDDGEDSFILRLESDLKALRGDSQ